MASTVSFKVETNSLYYLLDDKDFKAAFNIEKKEINHYNVEFIQSSTNDFNTSLSVEEVKQNMDLMGVIVSLLLGVLNTYYLKFVLKELPKDERISEYEKIILINSLNSKGVNNQLLVMVLTNYILLRMEKIEYFGDFKRDYEAADGNIGELADKINIVFYRMTKEKFIFKFVKFIIKDYEFSVKSYYEQCKK